MVRVDTDMDIAEEEPEAGDGTRCVVEGEPDGISAQHSGDSEHHTHTAVPLSPAHSQDMRDMDPRAEYSQGPMTPSRHPTMVRRRLNHQTLIQRLEKGI